MLIRYPENILRRQHTLAAKLVTLDRTLPAYTFWESESTASHLHHPPPASITPHQPSTGVHHQPSVGASSARPPASRLRRCPGYLTLHTRTSEHLQFHDQLPKLPGPGTPHATATQHMRSTATPRCRARAPRGRPPSRLTPVAGSTIPTHRGQEQLPIPTHRG
ncbi:uncharacterized protein LOC126371001 [Pectinophora gossypiella]|uniref:uncharacterized protein LOC126371001 n=1 Tax=Pectinophora gossypiella TaxID=13191 RepID=UPI00214E6AF6|nr:uncharacterized protein LOC126371001 [Pectinophora gossypiella]